MRSDVLSLLPELTVLSTSLLILVLAIIRQERFSKIITGLGLALAFIFALFLLDLPYQGFYGTLKITSFERVFTLVFLLGGILVLLLFSDCFKERGGEIYFLLLISILGMMLVTEAEDILVFFFALEIVSFPLYILVFTLKEKLLATESTLKLFLVGTFSSTLLLFGIVLLYGELGTTQIKELLNILEKTGVSPNLWVAFAMFWAGLGFKLVFVPFHFWTPDVFQGAPSPVLALLATGPKTATLAILIKLFTSGFVPFLSQFTPYLFWITVLTMSLGNLAALRENNLKRMLAFSTIAHVGYLLIGIIANTKSATSAIPFYLAIYTIATIGSFAVLTIFKEEVEITNFRGLAIKHPLLAFCFTIFLLALAGIPPTSGFMAKFYLFMGAIEGQQTPLVIIGFVNGVVSLYYYLRVVVFMYMTPKEEELVYYPMPLVMACIGIGVFLTLYLGIFPEPLGQLMAIFKNKL